MRRRRHPAARRRRRRRVQPAASRHADIQYALQLALSSGAPIAELLLAHQAEVASVNLCAVRGGASAVV